jgi:hypothetical protein
MAIRAAADPTSQSAYKLRSISPRGNKPPSSYVVSGKAFTAYYDIPTESAHRWTAQVDDGMLIIDLKEPGLKVVSNRNRNGNRHGQQRERSLLDG